MAKKDKAAEAECQMLCPLCWAIQTVQGIKSSLKDRIPQDFWEHRAAARRESLLALRSLVDAALACAEATPARKVTRIKVE